MDGTGTLTGPGEDGRSGATRASPERGECGRVLLRAPLLALLALTLFAGLPARALVRIHVPSSAWYTRANSGLPTNHVSALAADRRGVVWVGTDGYGLHALIEGRWRRVPITVHGVRPSRVRAIATGPGDELWVGTARGLAHRRGGEWDLLEAGRTGLPDSYVTAIRVDEVRSRVWVATEGGVGLRIPGGIWLRLGPETPGLPDFHVRALALEASGQAWLGTHRGLLRAGVRQAERAALAWERPPGLPPLLLDTRVTAVAISPSGDVWAGTEHGLYRGRQGRWAEVAMPGSRPAGRHVLALAPHGPDGMWVGTRDGLLLRRGGVWTSFDVPPAEISDDRRVEALATGPDGTLWAGTLHGLVAIPPALVP